MFNDDKLQAASFILVGIGLVDSLYLTWAKLTHSEVVCGGIGECQTVNNSPYSEIGGVPIALLGMGAYFVLLTLLYLETLGGFWLEYSRMFIFGISLAGVLYSAYLTFIEISVLQAICLYCVVSAIVMLLLFFLSIMRLMQDQPE